MWLPIVITNWEFHAIAIVTVNVTVYEGSDIHSIILTTNTECHIYHITENGVFMVDCLFEYIFVINNVMVAFPFLLKIDNIIADLFVSR